MAIDLSHVRVVDDHCHGILARQPVDLASWRGIFTESPNKRLGFTVPESPWYPRLIRGVSEILRCPPDEEAVFEARSRLVVEELTAMFLRDASIAALLVDTGYPAPAEVMDLDRLGEAAGSPVFPILRLETLMEDLVATHASLREVEEALVETVAGARDGGFVALKSIAAYRGGLEIRPRDGDEVEAAFASARIDVQEKELVRLGHRPLLDHLLLAALAEAARSGIPVQFHAGYGDTDVDLRLADPLHLRPILENPALAALTVVVLHAAYPFTRQAAFLAALYEGVHLDLSYAVPFLGRTEMLDFTRSALALAPSSKLMYSSDAIFVPELHWSAAAEARRALGTALAEMVALEELHPDGAESAGEAILAGNARRVYSLP
jgi:predicted TIM-barrel fold metal-dependent hydrolase